MSFVNLISNLASAFGNVSSKECFYIVLDEPKCPKSLIK